MVFGMVDFVIDRAQTPPDVVLEQITRTIVEQLHPRRVRVPAEPSE